LLDHYHRFHFRFLDPNLHLLEQGRYDQVWALIQEQFRAFIGASAFEELCREWVWRQADRGRLSFTPEIVGSHWGRGIQIDVAALNWRSKTILLGEAKWGTQRVSAAMVREFLGRANQLAAKEFAGWEDQIAYFARAGFTEAAQQIAAGQHVRLISLKELAADLLE
jgi:predicted N-acetyltransferase YhbS